MPHVTYTLLAQADLAEIVLHIAEANMSASDRFVDDIDRVFGRLARLPESGEILRRSRRRGVRTVSFGNYVIYYRPLSDGVEILRVWHGPRGRRPRF